MASDTESKTIGDVLKFEQPNQYSREGLTVNESQTILMGSVCKQGTGGRVIIAGAAADEVQTITTSVGAGVDAIQSVEIGGTATGGTIKFGIRVSGDIHGGIQWTDAIAWDTTPATFVGFINTALDDLLGATLVVAADNSGSGANPKILFTFSGAGYTDRVQGEIGVDVSAFTGATIVTQSTTVIGGGSVDVSGDYRIGVLDATGNRQWTSQLAADAVAATINTALDDAVDTSAVVASGGPLSTHGTPLVLTFSGVDYTGEAQDLVVLDLTRLVGCDDASVVHTTVGGQGSTTGVDAVQTGAIAGTLSAGNWTLTFFDANDDEITTANIAFGADNTAIQSAIDTALSTSDSIVVSGTAITGMIFTFSGADYTERPQQLMTIQDVSLVGSTSILITVVHTTRGHSGGVSKANAVALKAVTTSGGETTTKGLFAVRDCIVDRQQLEFGSANAADTIVELAEVGIIVREEA